MKIDIDSRTNLPKIKFEESDYLDAANIQEMINGQFLCRGCGAQTENRGWKILEGYYRSAREAIIEKLKTFARSRAKRDLCDNMASLLDGFDQALQMPAKIVLQADMMRIKNKDTEENKNDDGQENAYGD